MKKKEIIERLEKLEEKVFGKVETEWISKEELVVGEFYATEADNWELPLIFKYNTINLKGFVSHHIDHAGVYDYGEHNNLYDKARKATKEEKELLLSKIPKEPKGTVNTNKLGKELIVGSYGGVFEASTISIPKEKLTSLDNTKIEVNSPEESEEVQKAVFKLGGSWSSGEKFTRYLHSKYIYVDSKLRITKGTNKEELFNNHRNKQITIDQIRELVKSKEEELPKDNWYVVADKKNIDILKTWFRSGDMFLGFRYGILNGERKDGSCSLQKEVTTEQFKKIIGYKEPVMYMGFEVRKYPEMPIVEVKDDNSNEWIIARLEEVHEDYVEAENASWDKIQRVPKELQNFA